MLRRVLMILTLLAVLAPAAARAQSPSSACLAFPVDTAQQWTSLFPNPAQHTEQICVAVCNKWVQTCVNMANASYRCFYALFLNMSTIDTSDCTGLSQPSKGDCVDSSKDDFRNMVSNLASDLEEAIGICNGNFQNCFNSCFD